MNIEKAQIGDLESIFQIYLNAKAELELKNIFQWTNNYPTIDIIKNDLKKGSTYVLKNIREIVGAINISEEQEKEYLKINWEFNSSKVLVIHRLVVNPKYQKKGHAKKLMNFAEDFAQNNNYSSIRLDVYSQNSNVINFYRKRNYYIRGTVNFPEREYHFYCMEKEIKNN